jgi:hypothetical protein
MDQPRKSSRYKYPSVVDVAAVLITARHWLPWELEAPARHAIHTMLILHGMGWARADWLGHSLVGRARIENGVRQPEGYDNDFELSHWLPDYDNPCPICGGPFCRAFLEQVHCSTACAHRGAAVWDFVG